MLSEKPWKPDAVLNLLAGLFVCVGVGALLAAAFLPGEAVHTSEGQFASFVVSTLSLHGGTLLLMSAFLRWHRTTWREAFGFASPGLLRTLGFGFIMAAAMVPLTWLLMGLSSRLMELVRVKAVTQTVVQTLQNTETFDQRAYFAFATVLVAPLVEESLFRGILYPVVKQAGYPRLAWWGVSLFFALTHFNAASFASLTLLSFGLIYLYEKTNNLLAPILAHSLFNLANFFALTYPDFLEKLLPHAT